MGAGQPNDEEEPTETQLPQESTSPSQAEEGVEATTERTRRIRLRPTLPLPSARMKFEKELEMLRAYVSQSKSGTNPVDFKEVAKLIDIDDTAISSSKKFWEEIGALIRVSQGKHKPSTSIIRWANKVDFDPNEANAILHTVFDGAWFGAKIREALEVNRQLDKERLTVVVANIAGGEKNATGPRVRLLMEMLLKTGYLRETEEGSITMAAAGTVPKPGMDADSPPGALSQDDVRLDVRSSPEHRGTTTLRELPVPSISLNLAITEWSVSDVIRLLEYLRRGKDAGTVDDSKG